MKVFWLEENESSSELQELEIWSSWSFPETWLRKAVGRPKRVQMSSPRVDSELQELKIQTSRSWKSTVEGALLGAALEQAIEQDFPTSNRALGRGQKEKVCD